MFDNFLVTTHATETREGQNSIATQNVEIRVFFPFNL